MLERLRALPGVDHVTFASTVPFGDMTEGRDVHVGDRKASAIYVIVGADYFKTLGLPMLRGREFTAAEEEVSARAGTLAIVNEPLARKLFGDADPIGRQLQAGEAERGTERTFDIVGVAPGLRHEMFDAAPVPQMYVASGGPYRGGMNVHLHAAGGPGSESALFEPVRRALHDVDPRLPIVSMRTMAAHRDASILSWSIRAGAGLFSAFGLLALLLATIGVYGLKAYDVSRRTREIGSAWHRRTSGDVQCRDARVAHHGDRLGVGPAGRRNRQARERFAVSRQPVRSHVLAVAAAVLSATAMLACYLPPAAPRASSR